MKTKTEAEEIRKRLDALGQNVLGGLFGFYYDNDNEVVEVYQRSDKNNKRIVNVNMDSVNASMRDVMKYLITLTF